MSYSSEKSVVGRTPFPAIKLSLDYCTRTYGRDECAVGREASGTAQAGGVNTITISASDSFGDDTLIGYVVYISGGTGAGQEGRITANDNGTKIVTVADNWVIQPDVTSTYVLINRPDACYNTRSNCQDVANYNGSPTENEIWVTGVTADFPADIWDEAGLGIAVPTLDRISATPPKIDIAGGLGNRASISINCIDFPHHDRGVDKYALNRSYNAYERGTFWGKFVTRNTYYQGRTLTYYDGYLVNGLFDITNFNARVYIIEKITGPDSNGRVSIIAKDILKLADDDRSFAPAPSKGTLDVDFLSTDTSIYLVPGNNFSIEYGKSGYVRINSEIIYFTDNTNDILSGLTRQTWGTALDSHDAGDSVQLCLAYENVNVVDIVEDLYMNYTDIPSSYIPSTDWAVEKNTLLSSNNLTAIISEPTGINKLVKELVQQNLMYVWWADSEQEIKLKAFAPITTTISINDNDNILANSIKIWHEPKLRVSQFWMYYAIRDYTNTDIVNYRNLYIQVDSDTESADKYDETRRRRIESRWLNASGGAGLVLQIAGRTLSLLSETPRLAKFRLDAKDEVETGDFITLTTRLMQDASGLDISLDMLVIEKRQIESGTIYEYLAQEFNFTGKYGYIGPDTLPDYSGDTVLKQDGDALLTEIGDFILLEDAIIINGASDEQKSAYAWIAPDSGYFANGDEAYKIL